jgi:TolB-like protein
LILIILDIINNYYFRRCFVYKKVFILLAAVLLLSCSTTVKNTTKNNFPKSGTLLILPFENLSQTPYAGFKAASVTEGVLRSYGFKTMKGYKELDGEFKETNVTDNSFEYILKGRVVEWRYKTGIDGEPAVSLLIILEDKNGNLLWSAVGGKSQWGHRSIAITAQQLINDIFDDIK